MGVAGYVVWCVVRGARTKNRFRHQLSFLQCCWMKVRILTSEFRSCKWQSLWISCAGTPYAAVGLRKNLSAVCSLFSIQKISRCRCPGMSLTTPKIMASITLLSKSWVSFTEIRHNLCEFRGI